MVEQAIVPEAELDEGASRVVPVRVPPAEIRALAFLASLGPASPPVGGAVVDQVDLAGEEAFLGYLARIAPSSAA